MHLKLKGSAIPKKKLTAKSLAIHIAQFASDKKADDIIILEMAEVVNFCDFFVICSGNTSRQVKAIADGIDEGLSKLGVKAKASQAMHKSAWIVFDLGDIVVHIFDRNTREFYQLEHLWQEAKVLDWEE